MKVKHLFYIIIFVFIVYLDVYTITHWDLYYRNPTAFEMLAGLTFLASSVALTVLLGFLFTIISKKLITF